MKIAFFKNEEHFYPHLSYTCENAEKAVSKYKTKDRHLIYQYAALAVLLVYLLIFRKHFAPHLIPFFLIFIFLLPIHELCHVLYCLISGRKVDHLCFFPYGFAWKKPGAYVKPQFSAWSKTQIILFLLFPLIILSLIPAIMSIFLPSIRIWLLFIAINNVSMSALDINNSLYHLFLPAKCVIFDGFALLLKDNSPAEIHRIYIDPNSKEIHHRQFSYFNSKLTEIFPPVETDSVKWIKSEITRQANKP